jgi:tetratricopeptide (TPR) repeat protein
MLAEKTASWNDNKINEEIAAYSRKLQEGPKFILGAQQLELPNTRIAVWGNLVLESLDKSSRDILAEGGSPKKGILIDTIANLTRSAQKDLPLYRVDGGAGFIWIASNDNGRGIVKVVAIDHSKFSYGNDATAMTLDTKQAFNQCHSGNPTERVNGCTIIINGKGFGSRVDLATALDARCWGYNDLQQYERGLADCKAAISLHPKYPYAYENLGTSLLGLGRAVDAITAYTKSIELKPTRASPFVGRGRAFLALADKEAARKDFEYALMIDASNEAAKEALAAVYLDLGASLMGLGRFTEAIAAYTKSIELKPTLIDSRIGRGHAFLELKDKEAARREFQDALTLDPANEQAKRELEALTVPAPPGPSNKSTPVPRQSQQTHQGRDSSATEKSTPGVTNFVIVISILVVAAFAIGYFVSRQSRKSELALQAKDRRHHEHQLRSGSTPSIVISYRRADSASTAGRIFDELVSRFGKEHVFIDIDNIPLGIDYRTYIAEVLSKTGVLLAVIGPGWLGDKQRRRIDSPDDLVRIEIQTALQIGVPIIPVVVDYASMPRREDLPEGIEELAFRNAAEVSPGGDFHVHMDRLAQGIKAILYGETSSVNNGRLLPLDEATQQSS